MLDQSGETYFEMICYHVALGVPLLMVAYAWIGTLQLIRSKLNREFPDLELQCMAYALFAGFLLQPSTLAQLGAM